MRSNGILYRSLRDFRDLVGVDRSNDMRKVTCISPVRSSVRLVREKGTSLPHSEKILHTIKWFFVEVVWEVGYWKNLFPIS